MVLPQRLQHSLFQCERDQAAIMAEFQEATAQKEETERKVLATRVELEKATRELEKLCSTANSDVALLVPLIRICFCILVFTFNSV